MARSPIRLLRSTAVVSTMTLLSRVFGLLRDVIFAIVFGAGAEFDAFVVAFKLPNFMRRLFAEGAFSQAFVPILSEYQSQREHQDVKIFLNHVAGLLGLSLAVLVILFEISAPIVMLLFAPGFVHDALRYQYATHMLHITFPYLLLIALTAFSGAILNTCGRFAVPAFTPVLLNLVMILVACFWAPHTAVPIYTLAWGVILGGVAQLLLQLPFLYRLKLLPVPRLCWNDAGVRRVLKLMVPAFFGVSVAQISLLIDNFFASFLQAGSISWLYYSDRLIYLPQGVIGVALATVVLPGLSRYHAKKNQHAHAQTLIWAIKIALLLGLPAAVGLFLLAGPVLTTLIYHGAFDAFDVRMTAHSLQAFTLGLPAFMLIKVLASGFYSQQNIRTPVKIAALALLVNLVFNALLIYPLAHVGLALSTAIAAIVNAGLLLITLYRYQVLSFSASWVRFALRLLLANTVMASLLMVCKGDWQQWLNWSFWSRAWHLAGLVMMGMGCYVSCLWLSGLRKKDLKPSDG